MFLRREASVDFPVPGEPVKATTLGCMLFVSTKRREELNMRFRMVQYGRYRSRFITTEPGREQDVVSELNKMTEIKEAMVLFGEFDVYCKVVLDDFSQLSNLILHHIRTLVGVVDTTTLTAAYNGQ